MRILLLITSLFLLTNCNVAEETSNSGDNTSTGTKDVKFKTVTGGFENLSTDNITLLKVAVTDSTGATTVIKSYSLPESSNRAKDLGLHQPGQKNLAKLKKTGNVAIDFIAKGTTQVFTRNFDIYNYEFLQDTVFPDVVYTTNNTINFDWLEQK